MRNCPRRSIRSMSQRRKGPRGPSTSSTIPSWSPPPKPPNPRARAVLLTLPPNTRSSFTPGHPLGARVSV
ncbi:synuclein beta [Phyllostomus discolor]|uniref:Synuclein beta n=1 Tax=Phyllostomus discolor TaxID=89673 RepID=A0A833Z1B9_9CHIR|nr:synuclein beta [Phyllostomus discolor]